MPPGHIPPPQGQYPPAPSYGYPPAQGYGYPPQQQAPPAQPQPNQYATPQGQVQFPPQHQQQPPQQQSPFPQQGQPPFQQPGQFAQPNSGPNWESLADAAEKRERRSRQRKIGAVVLGLVLVVGGVGGYVLLAKPGKDNKPIAKPSTSASAPASGGSPTGAPVPAPAVTNQSGAINDVAGGAYPATIGPKAYVDDQKDRKGHGLELSGQDGSFAQTSGPVLDASASFTVSALVRNDAPVGGRSAVSQGSTAGYSFNLGRENFNGVNKWAFKVNTAAGDGHTKIALSQQDATTGRWTLLTGVYDAPSKQITLYVDGVLASSTPVDGVLNVAEPAQLGRAIYQGQWVDSWSGAVARIQLWKQALPAAKVGELSSASGTPADMPPVAAWIMG